MKCTKSAWYDKTKECECDHPCPFHDLVIDFEQNPPAISLPMDNAELIKDHLSLLPDIAVLESAKHLMKKVIFTSVTIANGKIEGDIFIQPHQPPNWINVVLENSEN